MASLLDTGACERLRRHDRAVELMTIRFSPPLICVHVAAELLYGWYWGGASDEELLTGQRFIESLEMLTPSLATAEIYADLRVVLRRAGKDMPDPDVWIAAHAIENRLPLISLDNHFTLFEEVNLHLLR